MAEFEQIAEHEAQDSRFGEWVSKDFIKSEGDYLPDADEAKLFKVILQGTDADGNERYLSTGIFETLDEAYEAGEALASEYSGDVSIGTTIVRAYY
jgi:hypothetical protein